MDQLIVEKNLIRQKKIIDLAMTKCLWINSAITFSRAFTKKDIMKWREKPKHKIY
jgi:hypothetical protein